VGPIAFDVDMHRLRQPVGPEIDEPVAVVSDDWFHLAPGAMRRVKLHALSGVESDIPPAGEIKSLGSSHRVAIEG
ncbi:hypothetical protein ACCT04_35980, partial [Rhizobium ruizarguesonis]